MAFLHLDHAEGLFIKESFVLSSLISCDRYAILCMYSFCRIAVRPFFYVRGCRPGEVVKTLKLKGEFCMCFELLNTIGETIKTADKATGLLSKLYRGIGFIPGFGGKRKDEEEAVHYLIEQIKNNSSIPPLLQAAYISKARETLKKYINQNSIVNLAIEQLSESNHAESVDDGWMSLFMDAAQHISNEEIQIIWGTLLARECNSPGTIPKTLLHTLSFIPSSLAKKFEEICSYNVSPFSPSVIIDYDHCQSFFNFTFYDLNELVRHNLIFFNSDTYGFQGSKVFICNDTCNGYIVEPLNKGYDSIPIGNVMLTADGEQLCSILSVNTSSSFDPYIHEFAKCNKLKLTKILIKSLDDERIGYEKID